jgi:FKBP-type peptidyl-prolyl cis-trans isomerase FkpA
MKKTFAIIVCLLFSAISSFAQQKSQADIDDALLQKYFKDNKITATKTASGLYYVISQKGEGANAKDGQAVTVNYTGRTMDGKAFDSNTDPAFGHVAPFTFMLGRHQVISGWDEGIALLNKGAKGVLYIPSAMAYGPISPDPSKIPANAIMIFDVELVSAQ